MASAGNDVIESSTDDATIDRKQSTAVESRDQETAVSPAVNAGVFRDGVQEDNNKSLERMRSTQRGSVLESNSTTSSTATDTEQHHKRSLFGHKHVLSG